MFFAENYGIAVMLCVVTMLCWGSWANTQKLAGKSWRFELFYWDYVLGIVLFSLFLGLTMGSIGDKGRGFVADIIQADFSNIISPIIGGIIFNLSNILLVASIALAGMAVAFPVGVGLAMVVGVIINYVTAPQGNPIFLFGGLILATVAIVLDALAYKKMASAQKKIPTKGIVMAIFAGILMSVFYSFITKAMVTNFGTPEPGKLTPYTAVFFFGIGILLSNFLFNTIIMNRPVEGKPVSYGDYFKGNFKTHLTGILGGSIWCLGTTLNIIASGTAGSAISYALGQGATLVGVLWGVFIWKEFANAPKGTNTYIFFMFVLYLLGIISIVIAGMQ